MSKSFLFFLNSDEKELFKKVIHFHFNLVKKSLFIWISLFLFIISQPIVLIISNFVVDDLIEVSLVIFLIPQIFLLILVFILINRFFSESKNNSIDYLFLSLPISKTKVFISRFLFIFAVCFVGCFFMFVLNFIFALSLQIKSTWILYFFVSNIFINSFICFFYISLITIFAIRLKRVWFAIVTLIFSLLIISPLVLRSNVNINQQNKIEYHPQDGNLFAKLSVITEDKQINTFITYEQAFKLNNNVLSQVNAVPIYSYFIPGEIISTFDSMLLKDLVYFSDDQFIDKNYSLIKNYYDSFIFANFDQEFSNVLILRPGDINPLNLDNEKYEQLIIANIKTILNDNSNQEYINLNDKLLVWNLFSRLNDPENANWINLTQKEINTLSLLLGINTEYNQLFYYHQNYDFLSKKTPNLLLKIEKEFNAELASLFEFLWVNDISVNNINNIFNNPHPVFENINNLYPSIIEYNDKYRPTKNDVNFIKRDLIRFQNSTIGYLKMDNTYQTINDLSMIDPSIIDEASWLNYVEANTLSLSDAKNLINKLSLNLKNMVTMNFSKNKINLNKFTYYFQLSNQTYLDNASIYVTTLAFIFIGTFWIAISSFKNTNYKNAEIN